MGGSCGFWRRELWNGFRLVAVGFRGWLGGDLGGEKVMERLGNGAGFLGELGGGIGRRIKARKGAG